MDHIVLLARLEKVETKLAYKWADYNSFGAHLEHTFDDISIKCSDWSNYHDMSRCRYVLSFHSPILSNAGFGKSRSDLSRMFYFLRLWNVHDLLIAVKFSHCGSHCILTNLSRSVVPVAKGPSTRQIGICGSCENYWMWRIFSLCRYLCF